MEIQLPQIIFQLINFGVVLGALTFLVYKPVLKTLSERSKKVQASQKAAEELIQQKTDIEKSSQKTLSAAKKEASELLAEAKTQADKKKDELMAKAKAETVKYLEDEKNKWTQEKQQLQKQLEKDINEAVYTISEKVLGEAIDKKAHAKLVDQSISEIVKAL